MSIGRIQRLRQKMLDVSHAAHRVRTPLSILSAETEHQPLVMRKAMAFALILREMPILIQDDELIVGARTMFLPRPSDSAFWDEGVKRNLDFLPDAETLNVEGPGLEFFPHYATEDEKALGKTVGIGEGYVTSHCTAGYAKVLRLGFGGIRTQARQRLREVAAESEEANFLNAVIICMDGATQLVQRYEHEARRLAGECTDAARKAELRTIADVCCRIKSLPAASFHDALQLLWFAHTMVLIENYNLMALGRLDQTLLPYYRMDQQHGVAEDSVRELLECFFIKCNDTSDLHTDNGLNIMLSGVLPDGRDGTNELTWLCLDAYEHVSLTDPQINLRYHHSAPPELLDRVLSICPSGPKPMIFNDTQIIESMLQIGVRLEDARNYCIDACQDLMIEGKSDFYPIFAGIYGIHLLTVFERIVDRLPEFESFETFWKALKDEIAIDVKAYAEKANRADEILPRISPTPFLSATLEGCIENARDKTAGGTIYNFTGFVGGGIVNVANSAAAIKKLVYEDKSIEAQQLVSALQNNFAEDEQMRRMLLNKAPKWGNNDEYVDQLGQELAAHFCTEVLKHRNPRGGRFVPGFFTHHQARLGIAVRATPDGRKRGEPLAVSLSRSIGTERMGPTGAVLSASRIDQRRCPLGTSLDLIFPSARSNGVEEREALKSVVKTYMDLGGMEFQANTLSPQLLREARQHPERHRDLVVRVWGFNAYFVTLKPEYQEDLIARAETL